MMNQGDSRELPVGVSYVSSDEKVASVKGNKIKALSNGDCVIYATVNGERSEVAQITVGWPVQNPVLPYSWNMFLTDPEPHCVNGEVLTYTGWDALEGLYCSNKYMLARSRDMKRWDVRQILSSTEDVMPYHDRVLWDCDGGVYNGKYYVYGFHEPDWNITPETPNGSINHAMFVLESDKPDGQYRNFHWLRGDKSGEKIDGISAQILNDDDGSRIIVYSSYIGSVCYYNAIFIARLKDDSTIIESTMKPLLPYLKFYCEGPSLRKRGDTYYLFYAANADGEVTSPDNWKPNHIDYATAKDPFGEWTYRGTIISIQELAGNLCIQGTAEPIDNQWYLYYHRVLNGVWNKRALCIEKMFFDDNGLIKPMVPTSSGVSEGFDPSETIPLNTAVSGKGYDYSPEGKYGCLKVASEAEIGIRYVKFTGKEKKLTLTGAGLEKIVSLKALADGEIIGESKGGSGDLVLSKVPKAPKGKAAELTIVVKTSAEVKLETVKFSR
jgi:hypothetical protein